MNHILVVEDDIRFNQIVCEYLNKNHFQAEGCLNPKEAYDLLYKKHMIWLISDIMCQK